MKKPADNALGEEEKLPMIHWSTLGQNRSSAIQIHMEEEASLLHACMLTLTFTTCSSCALLLKPRMHVHGCEWVVKTGNNNSGTQNSCCFLTTLLLLLLRNHPGDACWSPCCSGNSIFSVSLCSLSPPLLWNGVFFVTLILHQSDICLLSISVSLLSVLWNWVFFITLILHYQRVARGGLQLQERERGVALFSSDIKSLSILFFSLPFPSLPFHCYSCSGSIPSIDRSKILGVRRYVSLSHRMLVFSDHMCLCSFSLYLIRWSVCFLGEESRWFDRFLRVISRSSWRKERKEDCCCCCCCCCCSSSSSSSVHRGSFFFLLIRACVHTGEGLLRIFLSRFLVEALSERERACTAHHARCLRSPWRLLTPP